MENKRVSKSTVIGVFFTQKIMRIGRRVYEKLY